MYILNILSKAGDDFTSVAMMVTFSAGQSRASVSVPIIDDDVVEMTEIFTGSLSAVTESVMIGVDTADVTIIDNDSECIMTLYSSRCCVYESLL